MFISKFSVKVIVIWKTTLFLALCSGSINADPMRPPAYGQKSAVKVFSANTYELSQILISKERKRAVINEKVVGVGDSVSGASVILIDENKVTLNVAGKEKVLAINSAKGFKIKRETE